MIKIRSTEKLAKSEHNGLCDVSREMKTFTIDIKKHQFIVGIEDKLFQEQTIQEMQYERQYNETEEKWELVEIGNLDVVERLIIEDKGLRYYKYSLTLLDQVFEAVGVDIIKGSSGFSNQFLINALPILITQTQTADENGTGWFSMLNWVEDTPHRIVNNFTNI